MNVYVLFEFLTLNYTPEGHLRAWARLFKSPVKANGSVNPQQPVKSNGSFQLTVR